jgi:SRSO17 transposase
LEYRLSKEPLEGDLGELAEAVDLLKVDETKWEKLWDEMVRKHHYIGYESVIGGRVKYLITLGSRVVGAISFCSAAYKLGPRDRFIGWDETTRLNMLQSLVNNNRFLILPWIKVRNLASRVLSLSLKRLRIDWEKLYGVEPLMVETFIDRERFRGTSYAAANWICLGETKGFCKQGNGFVFHGQKKDIYIKVMSRRFANSFKPSLDRLRADNKEFFSMIVSPPIYYNKILDDLGVTRMASEDISKILMAHLNPYIPFLPRKELVNHFVVMEKGLLSNLERKSIEPICLNYSSYTDVRNTQFFMSSSVWDNEGAMKMYQKEASKMYNHSEAMLCGDGCDFPKQGKMSVGVERQYCGIRGKVDNCQASVMLGIAGENGYGIIDYNLYMPESWLKNDEDTSSKRAKCRVPDDVTFKTKNQLLSEMINKAIESGMFTGKYIGVDCAFGKDHNFLDSLPSGYTYFADIPCNSLVFRTRPEMTVPEYSGRGRRPKLNKPTFQPCSVKEIAEDDSIPWADVVLGNGAKGPIIAKDKCLRVVESRKSGPGKIDHVPGKDVWLYVRKLDDDSLKFAVSNESAEASIEAIRKPALMRWGIEQCFKECKDNLGMDHYEVRTWPGWRRHILLVMIAHLFVNKLRRHFGVKIDKPLPLPYVYVSSPVPLNDFLKAVDKLQNDEEINHPNIHSYQNTVQHPLTIGLIIDLLVGLIPKAAIVMKNMNHKLKQAAASFYSHAKKKIKEAAKKNARYVGQPRKNNCLKKITL